MAKRPSNSMSKAVAAALDRGGTRADYDSRPRYQRNDYLGWIGRAKTDETRQARIAQMIEELKRGGVYMGMKHAPSAKD